MLPYICQRSAVLRPHSFGHDLCPLNHSVPANHAETAYRSLTDHGRLHKNLGARSVMSLVSRPRQLARLHRPRRRRTQTWYRR